MTMNGRARGWADSKQTFESEANNEIVQKLGDLAEERLEQESYFTRLTQAYSEERDAHERRFVLRSTLITAFAHGGALFDTEWTIQGRFVFRQQEFGPADLLVAESQNHGSIAILAVASTEQEENTFSRIQKLCHYISDNITSIEADLGATLNNNDVSGAIALHGVNQTHVAEEMEEVLDERDKLAPVSVWQLDSGHSEKLALASWSDDDHPLDFVPGGGLGDTLEDEGIEIANTKHISIDYFSDSHHEKLFSNLYVWLFDNHVGREPTNSYFSKDELISFLREAADQPDREAADTRATELIAWWYEMDMIEQASNPSSYDDDAEVHSIVGGIGTRDIVDKELDKYRSNAKKAFLKKKLRDEFQEGGVDTT